MVLISGFLSQFNSFVFWGNLTLFWSVGVIIRYAPLLCPSLQTAVLSTGSPSVICAVARLLVPFVHLHAPLRVTPLYFYRASFSFLLSSISSFLCDCVVIVSAVPQFNFVIVMVCYCYIGGGVFLCLTLI